MRELMPLFSGTEFVVGALLAGWLLWVGAGGFLGGRIVRGDRTGGPGLFASLVVAAAFLLPITTVAIRFGRGLIVRPPGTLPPLGLAVAFALLVCAPFGFVYGTTYNVASVLGRDRVGGIRGSITRIYAWEAAGSFFGALIFSFVLIEIFSQFQAALVAALLVLLSIAAYPPGRSRSVRFLAAIAVLAVVAGSLSGAVDRASMAFVFPGYRVERHMASRHGELVVASRGEITSVFSGGGRLFSYPEPERAEETIHIPLLLCSRPDTVLLIGCSLGGGWEEALKHRSVRFLDCVEMEESLLEVLPRPGPGMRDGVEVRFRAADGRFYLSEGKRRYDCIILGSPPPLNLQWNRYYTREFFETVRGSLAPGGVFAFTHPSSENFLTAAQSKVLRVLDRTLREVFPAVAVLPGSTAHFVASDAPIDPGRIGARLAERRIDAPFVGEGYLPFRFAPERIASLENDLEQAGAPAINTDGRPSLPLAELALEGSRVGSRLLAGFGALLAVPPRIVAAALLAAIVLLCAVSRRGARARLAVGFVGCGSMLLQLLVLLSYQSFSGLLYHAIVLLTALFMAGAAIGAFCSMKRARGGTGTLRAVHAGFILLAVALPAWTAAAGHLALSHGAGSGGFLLFAACGGLLTGAYYPVVVRAAYPEESRAVPAVFYASDMFGACVGGFVGGLVLFPVLGLAGAVAIIVAIHLCAAAFLAGRW